MSVVILISIGILIWIDKDRGSDGRQAAGSGRASTPFLARIGTMNPFGVPPSGGIGARSTWNFRLKAGHRTLCRAKSGFSRGDGSWRAFSLSVARIGTMDWKHLSPGLSPAGERISNPDGTARLVDFLSTAAVERTKPFGHELRAEWVRGPSISTAGSCSSRGLRHAASVRANDSVRATFPRHCESVASLDPG